MRIRLRKPQEIIWLLAIVLVIVGLLLSFGVLQVPVAGMSVAALAFWIVLVAAALLILGTSVF